MQINQVSKRKSEVFNNPRDYIAFHLGKELIAFEKWAFGENVVEFLMLAKVPEAWNKMHPNNPMKGSGDVKEDCDMMLELWKKESNL